MHPIETPDKTFHDGDGVSELGTILPAWWLNQVQSELLAVLTAAGIQPDKSQPNQLLAALNKLAVVTTGNQEIGGDKTFTGLATLKKARWWPTAWRLCRQPIPANRFEQRKRLFYNKSKRQIFVDAQRRRTAL